ncbi:MAG: hypothetical protein PVF55_01985 [Desulfobacterales bacterium]|jgi:hypothetical protein
MKTSKRNANIWSSLFLGVVAVVFTFTPPASATTDPQQDVQSTTVPGQTAPRLQNLGEHSFPVTTRSARAQLFINQGLMQSLRAQGRPEAAAQIEARFQKAWKAADVTLTASRFMGKKTPALAVVDAD